MPTAGQDTRTLKQALRETAQAKWQGRRCYATNTSQASLAIFGLYTAAGRKEGIGAPLTVADVDRDLIRAATALWYGAGLAPATINKRLNCLSAMGVSVEGCRVREPKVLKWWLKPEDEEKLVAALEHAKPRHDPGEPARMASLIRWTTRTGLRIEESLRLTWNEVSTSRAEVTVPGLKTATAQATLPLAPEAVAVLESLVGRTYGTGKLVFGLTYDDAHFLWGICREVLRVSDNPTATLKALRRSAARHLHITKGMPLDMVRQYLRHEDIETTMGYLRLTGGYGTEEMRKWL